MIAKGALGDRRDRLGAGRDRRGARGRRQLRSPRQRHDDRRRRASTTCESSSIVVERAPRAIERLIELGVPFAHRERRAAPDPRGRAQPPPHRPCRRRHRLGGPAGAAKAAAAQHPNITLLPDMVAIDLVTGRHATHSRPAARSTASMPQPQDEAGRDADRAGDDPRHRRRRPRLSLFDRAARRDRRRHRHGVARGLPHLQHGVHAVPPDLPLQSRGQELPDHRGGARRRRAAQAPA